jgi:putative transposase
VPGHHSFVSARPETPPDTPPAPTGIDYAQLIDTAHQAELAHGVNYAALTHTTPIPAANPDGVLPGQLDLFTGEEVHLTTPTDSDNDGQVTS